MFKKLNDRITEKIMEIGDAVKDAVKAGSTPVDLSRFNSSVAERTEWTPLKPGGTSFRTHTFYKEPGIGKFKATKGVFLFSGLFMATGLIFPVLLFAFPGMESDVNVQIPFFVNLIPLVFFIAGFFILRASTKPIIFSRNNGYFWKGRLKEGESPEQSPLKTYCRLKEIEALQIVSERVRSSSSSSSGGSSSFKSYEINLVLHNGERINVIDHGNRKKLLEDAEKLASFLGVQVWDGTRH